MGSFGLTVGDEQQVIIVVEPFRVLEHTVVGSGELLRILVARRAGAELPNHDDAAETGHGGEQVTVPQAQVIGLLGAP